MVQTTHTGKNNDMLNAILEAAQKRFGLYGLEKTTMKEIATDIGMSKGSIYYYFPDKEHLYFSVVEKEMDQFIGIVDEKMNTIDDPADMLRLYVRLRLQHLRSMLNLSRFRYIEWDGIKSLMGGIWTKYRTRETEFISDILSIGIIKKIFKNHDPDEMAVLYLDILRGIRSVVMKNKELFYLDQEEFEALVKKQELFTEIFVNGLKV